MKKYSVFLIATILLFYFAQICLGQNTFQCQCNNIDLKTCMNSKGNDKVIDEAYKIYNELKSKKITVQNANFHALKPCNKINTFVAYYDESNGKRLIFYPASQPIAKLQYPDWQTKGALFHAIVHLQKNHTGKANANKQELEADSITAIYLKGLGAKYEEAILYLKVTESPKMPDYQSRINIFKEIYLPPPPLPPSPSRLSPTADFIFTCTNNCIVPCEISFLSTSRNITPETRYFWNGIEGRDNIIWRYEKPSTFLLTIRVLNPDGQESTIRKTVSVKRGELIDTGHIERPKLARWGIHAGVNYSINFKRLSPMAGLVFSIHPGFLGFQAELNYVRRIDEFSDSYSVYDLFWDDYNYYYNYNVYDVYSIELPLMLILGRNREPQNGFNFLMGIGTNYGLCGRVDYEEYISYANGSEYYDFGNRPIYFDFEDYKRLQFRGILGFTILSDRFCIGGRLDGRIPDFSYLNPEFKLYAMFRFH